MFAKVHEAFRRWFKRPQGPLRVGRSGYSHNILFSDAHSQYAYHRQYLQHREKKPCSTYTITKTKAYVQVYARIPDNYLTCCLLIPLLVSYFSFLPLHSRQTASVSFIFLCCAVGPSKSKPNQNFYQIRPLISFSEQTLCIPKTVQLKSRGKKA